MGRPPRERICAKVGITGGITIITTVPMAVAVPTDATLCRVCSLQHRSCYACRKAGEGGLGLQFHVQPDESVRAEWEPVVGGESYAGILHGGLQATVLDSAMVHALFARDVVARTGELNVRYLKPVEIGKACVILAWLVEAYPPLYRMRAEILQAGLVCARAEARFMRTDGLSLSPQSSR